MNENNTKKEEITPNEIKKEETINKQSEDTEKKEKNKNNKKYGKTLKVTTNELTFGKNDKKVNVFGLFRYKKNNTNYVVYADVLDEYNIIYYATAHIKGDSILTLDAKREEDNNVVKEYIYKLTDNESLEDYEMMNLDDIEFIEIIGFSKIEVKPEIASALVDFTISKKSKASSNKKTTTKKKSYSGLILILLILILGIYGGFYLLDNQPDPNAIVKNIVCKTNYEHEELEATVYEEKTFNFNNQDVLQNVDNLNSYVFKTPDDYADFVSKGVYFKYQPEDTESGGWSLEDETYTYKVTTKEQIDDNYRYPTNYEEILNYYKSKNYTCEESISK